MEHGPAPVPPRTCLSPPRPRRFGVTLAMVLRPPLTRRRWRQRRCRLPRTPSAATRCHAAGCARSTPARRGPPPHATSSPPRPVAAGARATHRRGALPPPPPTTAVGAPRSPPRRRPYGRRRAAHTAPARHAAPVDGWRPHAPRTPPAADGGRRATRRTASPPGGAVAAAAAAAAAAVAGSRRQTAVRRSVAPARPPPPRGRGACAAGGRAAVQRRGRRWRRDGGAPRASRCPAPWPRRRRRRPWKGGREGWWTPRNATSLRRRGEGPAGEARCHHTVWGARAGNAACAPPPPPSGAFGTSGVIRRLERRTVATRRWLT
ncbi:hypothetical protein BU14_0127s0019 [Porphyra umbilicalis]|uniref:Uncharacterized protein n=1 Tax=Porphyra umbilicalis TaxID=2786 RepID=A0A1X6PAJ8_PORUM|nr:hypothetical protein BU14_0127s0019 [Porphyra umbilicalis]|eukprot:OSX77921.1 hypothetical protein BU14_0127s0019 [Porphyra umbilicalis]